MIAHALDFPSLHTRPSSSTLLALLASLTLVPPSWDAPPEQEAVNTAIPGVEKWLTSIIASQLHWIEDEEEQEAVRETAASRLAERCGRSARPGLRRGFKVPRVRRGISQQLPLALSLSLAELSPGSSGYNTPSVSGSSGISTPALTTTNTTLTNTLIPAIPATPDLEEIEITLHEPSLTADNLGLKTWGSAHALSRLLYTLVPHLHLPPNPPPTRALELGAGTGLVGIAAAHVLTGLKYIKLTDLPEIVDNLRQNVEANPPDTEVEIDVDVLDWAATDEEGPAEKWPLVLAADPLYSPEHAGLLVGVLGRVLAKDGVAVVALPEREGYAPLREEWRDRMHMAGFEERTAGRVDGWDDWGEFGCRWGVWGWKEQGL